MKKNLANISVSTNYVNLERLTFLVDGVFAITLTLLVLDLRPPEDAAARLAVGLLAMLPRLAVYLIAFYTIANHWLVHQRTFRHITSQDTNMVWLTIISLLFITLMPASTAVMGRYPHEKLALAIFSGNSFLQSLVSWRFWAYVLTKQKHFARKTDPQMLFITTRVWLLITLGWLTSIFLSFLNIYATYASWILFPNLVAVWGNHRRNLLIKS